MRKNKQLLKEDAIASLLNGGEGGAFGQIVKRVLDDLKKFGDLLKSVAKLLVTDVNRIITTIFSESKTFDEYKKDRKEWQSKRTVQLTAINSKADELMSNGSLDGKVISLMLSPSTVLSKAANATFLWPFTADAKTSYVEMGFDKLPILGETLFDSDGVNVNWMGGVGDLLNGEGGDGDGGGTNGLVTSIALNSSENSLIDKINSVFINNFKNESPKRSNKILLEQADTENPLLKIPENMREQFMADLCDYMELVWPINRDELLQNYQQPFDKHLANLSKILGTMLALSKAKTIKEFRSHLKPLSKWSGIAIDEEKLQSGFEDMRKKVLQDDKAIAELEKEGFQVRQVMKEGNDANLDVKAEQQRIEQRLDEIVLNQFKGVFLQKIREELFDFYDKLKMEIVAGTTSEQREALKDTEYGKKFLSMMTENLNILNQGMQKLSNL